MQLSRHQQRLYERLPLESKLSSSVRHWQADLSLLLRGLTRQIISLNVHWQRDCVENDSC